MKRYKQIKFKMIKWFVIFLEAKCKYVHWIPGIWCTLAGWSSILDEKYKTGVWESVPPPDSKS